MPETKPRADCDGVLTGRDQAPGHQVDGSDVIGVQRVPESECVGEDGGAGEVGVVVDDDSGGRPEAGVYQDEEEDDADGGEREDA